MDHVNMLSELEEGQAARVTSLLSAGSMRRRLQDIGLIEGTKVEPRRRSGSLFYPGRSDCVAF